MAGWFWSGVSQVFAVRQIGRGLVQAGAAGTALSLHRVSFGTLRVISTWTPRSMVASIGAVGLRIWPGLQLVVSHLQVHTKGKGVGLYLLLESAQAVEEPVLWEVLLWPSLGSNGLPHLAYQPGYPQG